MLAMVFIAMFFVIAVGLASITSTTVQLSKNQRSIHQARLASESGMEYVKNVLSNQVIPGNVQDNDLLSSLYTSLTNFYTQGASNIQVDLVGQTINLPSLNQASITIGQMTFRATIKTQLDSATGKTILLVTVTGKDPTSGISRTVTANFFATPKGSSVFDWGVMCFGGICQSGGGSLIGDPQIAKEMSALPSGIGINASGGVIISGTAAVGGTPANMVAWSGGVSVNGEQGAKSTDPNAWFTTSFPNDTPPSVPTFTPEVFKTAVPLTDLPSSFGSTVTNIRIPPGRNTKLSNVTVNGIVYVESPNNVTFAGCTINGVIVYATAEPGTYDTLTLSSNKNLGPVPSGSSYDTVRQATAGYCILAPTANVLASGCMMSSSTAPAVGSIIAHRLSFSGGCILNVKDGSVIVLDTTAATSGAAAACNLSGCAAINISRTAGFTPPTLGMSDGSARRYQLNPSSYTEEN